MVLVLSGCSSFSEPEPEPEPVNLKLSWSHGVQFLGFYVAEEQGFYADENLSVTIEPLLDTSETTEIPERVAEGEFDFSTAARPLALAQARGVPVTAIALIGQLSPLAFFTRTGSGIQTPADLAGHSVAVMSEVSQNSLQLLLQTQGLTLDDVEQVPSGFDMTPFYEGDVDVWLGYLNDEVIEARQQGLELVTFPLYEYGVMGTSEGVYTSQQLLQNNPQLATRFLHASLKGWEWAVENPVEAVDIMLARFPELAAERAFHLASLDAYIPLVRLPDRQIGTIDCQKWLEDPLFAALDDTDGLCTTSILESARTGE